MTGFDYLRNANHYFKPRTPKAALKAVEEGVLPKEAYIYKATSVKPLNEEPVDIPEIERILAREVNDLETDLLLASILEHLIRDPDPEIALFGAESINAIENGYNSRIESFKKALAGEDKANALRGIATQFYGLARLNEARPAIRRFYLAEAYSYIEELYTITAFTRHDLELVVEILLALRLPDRARFILERLRGPIRYDPDVLMLRARVEFKDHRYDRLAEILERVRTVSPWVNAEQNELVRQWTEAARE